MEDTICLQCGDKGWDNSFVYCVKCLGFAVHRYCLDVIPATYDEYVRWICENCEVKEQHKHESLKQDVGQCQTGDHDISKNISRVSEIETNKNDTVVIGAQISADSVPCQLGDDDISKNIKKVLEIEEKQNDLNGVKCVEPACKLLSVESRGVIDKNATVVEVNEINEENGNDNISSKENKGKTGNVILKSNMEKERDLPCTPDAKPDKNGHSTIPDNGSLSKSAKKRRRRAKKWTSKKRRRTIKSSNINLEEHKLGTSSAELNSEHPITSCNESSRNNSKKRRKSSKNKKIIVFSLENLENNGVDLENQWSDMSTERRVTRSSNCNIKHIEFVAREDRSFASHDTSNSWNVFQKGCQESPEPLPIIKPIWRGSFKIWNKKYDIYDGLMAHLSNRACQKVYEEACQFQTVLHLEMLPKTEIWPKSFQKSKPSAENIALYFFPSEKSERAFDHLVEDMLGEELAMRATVQNAELLIFPSTELPMKYWRFQDKHYLWGVFRGKQQPVPSHSHSDTPWALPGDT